MSIYFRFVFSPSEILFFPSHVRIYSLVEVVRCEVFVVSPTEVFVGYEPLESPVCVRWCECVVWFGDHVVAWFDCLCHPGCVT